MNKVERTIKLYPIFTALSYDVIMFFPISTLFLTMTKGLSAAQISSLTTIALLSCILLQKPVSVLIDKIGNLNTLRLGSLLLLVSVLCLTFGKSFVLIAIFRVLKALSFLLRSMSKVILKNNLKSLGKQDKFYDMMNNANLLYSATTIITTAIAGYLFNINNYLPMYIEIVICIIAFILTLFMYEDCDYNSVAEDNSSLHKVNLNPLIVLVFISSFILVGVIENGRPDSELFMRYELQKGLSNENVVYYLTTIILICRAIRLVGIALLGKLYNIIRDKMILLVSVLLTLSFSLSIVGYFITSNFMLKVLLMVIGYAIVLTITATNEITLEDIILRKVKREEQSDALVKLMTSRNLGEFLLSLLFTLTLIKYEMICVMFMLMAFSIIGVLVSLVLYRKLVERK